MPTEEERPVLGLEGVQAVLSLLNGYEVPAAAWEPAVLASRVKEFTPQWLDQLCFTGRIGWPITTPRETYATMPNWLREPLQQP